MLLDIYFPSEIFLILKILFLSQQVMFFLLSVEMAAAARTEAAKLLFVASVVQT